MENSRIELKGIVWPVPSNQIKVTFIIVLPFNLVHLCYFLFHIAIEGRGVGGLLGGGAKVGGLLGGAKGMLAPLSNYRGGLGPLPPPPPLFLRLCIMSCFIYYYNNGACHNTAKLEGLGF